MSSTAFAPSDDIRSAFSDAMSTMYRTEVPLYGDLIDIVETVNRQALADDPGMADDLRRNGEIGRLGAERHGAIRVGTPAELSMMRRAFAVMGMHPVGYYDLAIAGVPVHSTAFRPVDLDALNRNPFRVFTSLLRLELIEDVNLRETAGRILAERRIFSNKAVDLVERWERQGGLDRADADAFVGEILKTFRWQSDALVDQETYERLLGAHRLVADVVSFKGPHINHLTPRTLDIDAAQDEMPRRGISAKAVIEGPPPRRVPVLLRQTSFKALEEEIRFLGQGAQDVGTHTARFGEIEQRGVALTRKGRELYDRLLGEVRGGDGSQAADYGTRLRKAFEQFPDNHTELRRAGLAFYRYETTHTGARAAAVTADEIEAAINAGWVTAEPVIYEDFLPVSAAGIFQSNLGGGEQRSYSAATAQASFEEALGSEVLNEFDLYETLQRRSLERALADLNAAARAVQAN
jgi:uncharacterized glyoxalase superfamily metalloenzyme YdcJ